ncbi:hypothetical protein TI39_contig287g00019 [Zymoseptoria brevis]|uniref:DUF6594 domain-containing protein n=1 Tax=Zymoseptoria brevis TaxID=1047168 RepID=A0A0F4GWD0_9PEZI|nr:hypothetical protein TI39_contig287g00019 [Zymoseptoria brevis]
MGKRIGHTNQREQGQSTYRQSTGKPGQSVQAFYPGEKVRMEVKQQDGVKFWRIFTIRDPSRVNVVEGPLVFEVPVFVQQDHRADEVRSVSHDHQTAAPEGYSKIATFQSSDPNFLQYRKFGYLHSRVLSALQFDIEKLEKQLDKLDDFDKSSPNGDARKLSSLARDNLDGGPERLRDNHEFQNRFDMTRPEVVAELRMKLAEYDEMLLKTKAVTSLQKPSRMDYEATFILRKEDIITLRDGRERAAFDNLVERALAKVDKFLTVRCRCALVRQLFTTPELRAKTSDKLIHYYAPARVDSLVNAIITAIIFMLIILPVVTLYQMSEDDGAKPFEAIGVLMVFALLFGCAMSSLTKASRQELFGASAAYCAVLVVFVSNFTTQTVNIEK